MPNMIFAPNLQRCKVPFKSRFPSGFNYEKAASRKGAAFLMPHTLQSWFIQPLLLQKTHKMLDRSLFEGWFMLVRTPIVA